jgi:NTP pyrophosphatase (non-canonical NTP hydrolase)
MSNMSFSEYQKRAYNLNFCKEEFKMLHALLGLPGEVGEVCEKFKKLYRDKDGNITDEFKTEIKKELSDVLWYIADICTLLNIDLQDVADSNIAKLESRVARGTIQGSGDNR